MKKPFTSSLFIFRRDLRIQDNTALDMAIRQSTLITPIFIFDPRQANAKNNKFFSKHAFIALLQSLIDLEKQLKKVGSSLTYCYGEAENVVKTILETKQFDSVFLNADYTPFSLARDQKIDALCANAKIPCYRFHDALLIQDPAQIKNKQGHPYKIFSAFLRAAQRNAEPVQPKTEIKQLPPCLILPKNLTFSAQKKALLFKNIPKKNAFPGGTDYAKSLLKQLAIQNNYDTNRNIPHLKTTELSLHNKFGTISIRTVYHAIKKQLGSHHELIRQLYWRDFFSYTIYHYPLMLTESLRPQNKPKRWNSNQEQFIRWTEGKTGVPIIDAGMRQLNQTGYMHNRVRMLTASYLVKNLKIDWKKGAHYFAQKLVDYDPAVNAGNWQWISSTGYDAQPPFRTFNPWTQQKKFDPECIYIKTWVPELKTLSARQIQKIEQIPIPNYHKPSA